MVPGIGAIQGFCASSHASATCAGVACFCSANALQPVDEGEIGLAILLRKTRHHVPEVGGFERRVLVDRAGEKSLAERTERDESDAQFFQRRQDLLFRLTPPKRVLALQRRNRLDRVCPADRLHARFGQTEVLHLAFANQVLDRTGDVLDRHVGIDTVLVEQIDAVRPEALQRRLGYLADVLGPAVETSLLPVLEPEPELRRNDDLIPNGRERFADDLFVRERAVHLCRVEEGDAAVDRRADHRDALFTAGGRSVAEADAHAPEAEGRHFQSARAQSAFLHCAVTPAVEPEGAGWLPSHFLSSVAERSCLRLNHPAALS